MTHQDQIVSWEMALWLKEQGWEQGWFPQVVYTDQTGNLEYWTHHRKPGYPSMIHLEFLAAPTVFAVLASSWLWGKGWVWGLSQIDPFLYVAIHASDYRSVLYASTPLELLEEIKEAIEKEETER